MDLNRARNQWLLAVGHAGRIADRFWSWLALGLAVLLVVGVDKIRALFVSLPRLSLLFEDPFHVGGMWLWVFFLVALYLACFLALWPGGELPITWREWRLTRRLEQGEVAPPTPEGHPPAPQGFKVVWTLPDRVVALASAPARWTGRVVDAVLANRLVNEEAGPDVRLVRGIYLLLIAAMLTWVLPDYWKALGVFVLVVAVLLIYSDPLDNKAEIPERRLLATRIGVRGLLLVSANGLFGVALWFAVVSEHNTLTLRLFTLWGVVQFCLMWLAWATFVDSLNEKFGRRVFNGLVLLLGLLIVDNHGVQLGSPCEQQEVAWFDHVEARLDSMGDENEPVLFVAAAGGGSRAALYATLVLEALERTPTSGDIGGWDALEDTDSLASRVLLVSSVSGGSVAAAHWAHGRREEPEQGEAHDAWEAGLVLHTTNTIEAELAYYFNEELAGLCEEATGLRYRRLCDPNEVAGHRGGPWPMRSWRFDALSADFTAPLVRGVLLPGVERGESMTHFWRSAFHWDAHARQAWSSEDEHPPLLLVNVTDVEGGKRIVAGEPRLPRKLLREGIGGMQASSISDHLGDDQCVSLEESVRMSANFPWGFGLPSLGNTDLRAIDGGVLDNTGIDTLAVLVERLEYLADHSTGSQYEELHPRAIRLMDRLASRGVIVLEIDSGAKPEQPGPIAEVLAGVFLPVHSLNTSSYRRALASTTANLARLETALSSWAQRRVATGEHGEAPREVGAGLQDSCAFASGPESTNLDVVGERVRHVVYALDTEGIMTAWALTPRQKGQILARFLHEDALQRTALQDAYQDMRGQNEALGEVVERAKAQGEFADLMETIAWDRRELQRLEEAAIAEHTQLRLDSLNGPVEPEEPPCPGWVAGLAEVVDSGACKPPVREERVPHKNGAGWAYVGYFEALEGRWSFSALDVGPFRTQPLDAGALVVTEEPLLVRENAPELDEEGGWELPTGLITAPTCVEVTSLDYSNGMVFAELKPQLMSACLGTEDQGP